MNFMTNYIKYLKDNPEKYWFKRKLYGWGWVPASWQGFATLAFFILFFVSNGLTLEGDIASSESEAGWLFVKLLSGVFALIWICYKTGESPRWQWGKRVKDK
jgi:hypothetical protein